MKVCVYAICKNESQFVDRFMDSMSEADYVCVLDTGSSDDTVKKLRARGAIVGETVVSPWRFDTARNESLGLIPADADICCAIDLDEQFHPGWRAALERAWQPDTTRARYRYTWSFRPDGSEGMVFWADKIHKNGCYRWASPVHETLAYTGEGAERFVDAAGVQLDHHPDETKSRGQYLPLLELAVREDPQNDRNCHYLGREYMFRGEWQKAIETLARHLTLPSAVWADERCASMRYIARCLRALEQDDSAERWLHRAVAEAPHLREPYMDYAQLLYAQERWYGLVDVLRAALAITERPRTYICEADAWGSLPYDLLSLAYAHLGDAENAADACRKAVKRSPQDERLRRILPSLSKCASGNARAFLRSVYSVCPPQTRCSGTAWRNRIFVLPRASRRAAAVARPADDEHPQQDAADPPARARAPRPPGAASRATGAAQIKAPQG